MKLLSTLATQVNRFSHSLRTVQQPIRTLVSKGSLATPGQKSYDQKQIDSAVNIVAGEVGFDQLEPHELKRMREDREKQLDIRNFTLNFGPQHPVRECSCAACDAWKEGRY